MAWVRLDDQIPRHRKMLRAGPAACWFWVCGLAHCQSQHSDGFIADEQLQMIGVTGATRCVKLAMILVAVGLFERVDGGYQIHDYLHFNETAEEALDRERQIHEARAKSGRAGGLRSAETRRLQAQATKQNASKRSKQNEAPTRPDPTRSDQTDERARATIGGETVLTGALPREHRSHATCDPTYSRCVPSAVHAKLKGLLAPKFTGDRDQADAALRAWYPTVWATLPETFVMPADAFKFWQTRFDPVFASTDAPAPGTRTPAPNADRTAEYLRQHRAGGQS